MKKYQRIYSDVKDSIARSTVREGDQLPTEAQLMERYKVSRPTVARALSMLEKEGLVVRSPGQGTFVRENGGGSARPLLFGLAFPELGHGEIFDPITSAIAELGKEGSFSLLWGTTKAKGDVLSIEELQGLFDELASRRVDGVFFAPLEGRENSRAASAHCLDRLTDAGIPVILIDRDLSLFPERSGYPLVAIDNVKAGYVVASHFLSQGEERVDFLLLPYKAYTVDLRLRGYQAAMVEKGFMPRAEWVHSGDPEDRAFAASIVASGARNVICGNDETAALFMSTLRDIGVAIPGQIRLAGFDDVRYSRLISVPLTTIRQPVREIARRAVMEMLGMVAHPGEAHAATTLLDCSLVVRKSSIVDPCHHAGKKE